ncbi:hypothetical protein ACJX0J_029875 [Zea mays]
MGKWPNGRVGFILFFLWRAVAYLSRQIQSGLTGRVESVGLDDARLYSVILRLGVGGMFFIWLCMYGSVLFIGNMLGGDHVSRELDLLVFISLYLSGKKLEVTISLYPLAIGNFSTPFFRQNLFSSLQLWLKRDENISIGFTQENNLSYLIWAHNGVMNGIGLTQLMQPDKNLVQQYL